jgi:hypothetical protein
MPDIGVRESLLNDCLFIGGREPENQGTRLFYNYRPTTNRQTFCAVPTGNGIRKAISLSALAACHCGVGELLFDADSTMAVVDLLSALRIANGEQWFAGVVAAASEPATKLGEQA